MVTTTRAYQPRLLPFTDFASVTPDTDLNQLNLNWKERDLPERIRTKHVHRLHPYLGKFVPQLVEIFLRKYKPQMVVDPFCGSGTTLVEATALGINSYGSDISEFNCLLSRVKTAEYDTDHLEREIRNILQRSEGENQLRLLERTALYVASSYLADWYAPEALQELLAYKRLIADYRYQDVLNIILSRAARSSRLTTHYDLDFPQRPQVEPYECYKHRRICKPTHNARQFLTRYSYDAVKRIREFASLRKPSHTQIVCGDSREITFPACDLVVTSPPYVGLIDYHEQHRYAYELLGLPQHTEAEIGSAARGNSQKAQKSYVDQIEEVFDNVKNSLTKGGHLVVVVHDRKTLYPEIAKRLGFKTETEIHRSVDRRTGRRSSDFYESVFVWVKIRTKGRR
ncbi:MAG: class I SAM-dependent methyltransferase [Chloroflexi bacterium]|nr:class I SAM-dependent methyltransferase [Chloroflexota bacterium]